MRKFIAVLAGAVAILGYVPAFAAEPINPVPALVQPVQKPMFEQPGGNTRFYTQWELHQAQIYRAEPGQYRESPGGGGDSGAGGGDSGS